MNDCAQCGMLIEDASEYHPYAACLMFLQCRDSEIVRANLQGVVEHGRSTPETEGEGMSTKELIVRLRGLTPHDSEYASLGKEAADKLDEATQYLRECRGLLGNILPAGMSDFIEGFEADTGTEP